MVEGRVAGIRYVEFLPSFAWYHLPCMKSVFHHLHLRKRGAHTTEPFPSKKFGIRMLDHMAIAAGIIGPVMALPQIYKIYFLHNASGVDTVFPMRNNLMTP